MNIVCLAYAHWLIYCLQATCDLHSTAISGFEIKDEYNGVAATRLTTADQSLGPLIMLRKQNGLPLETTAKLSFGQYLFKVGQPAVG